MVFYDFEVFYADWLVVINEPSARKETVIVNDREKLRVFYNEHKDDIWVGFNNNHYDQYILKGILLRMDPKRINDEIIVQKKDGWQISPEFNKIQMYNYDVFTARVDRGLKFFEGSMGNSIEESSVPFNIQRKLTANELEETIHYCRHDVEQTVEVFMERYSDFEAQMGLLKMFNLPLSDISKTKVQLSAKILGARKMYSWKEINDRQEYKIPIHDEFDIDFPSTMRIEKYKEVVEWYQDLSNMDYEKSLDIEVAKVMHTFGWGGVHGAKEKYIENGYFINMDVASLYPSLMIEYGLLSRSCKPEKFKTIVKTRLKYKAEKNPLQAPLKIVINGTYGASKDMNNPLFDPRQANRVCVYGQLLLLDLIEHLEPYCEIIQSNTDGVLVKLRAKTEEEADREYQRIDDIAYEWEHRVRLNLEFDEYRRVIQKDVNNYIIVAADGHWKTKGAYVKKLGNLDYDLAVVNKAVIDYLVHGIPVEKTINECNSLREFQMIKKISAKYQAIYHGDDKLNEKCVRCFASTRYEDMSLTKVHQNGKSSKIEGTPRHSHIINGDLTNMKVPMWLDKEWYIRLANERIEEFTEGMDAFDF